MQGITRKQAADLLKVGKSRVDQFLMAGKLTPLTYKGERVLTADNISLIGVEEVAALLKERNQPVPDRWPDNPIIYPPGAVKEAGRLTVPDDPPPQEENKMPEPVSVKGLTRENAIKILSENFLAMRDDRDEWQARHKEVTDERDTAKAERDDFEATMARQATVIENLRGSLKDWTKRYEEAQAAIEGFQKTIDELRLQVAPPKIFEDAELDAMEATGLFPGLREGVVASR